MCPGQAIVAILKRQHWENPDVVDTNGLEPFAAQHVCVRIEVARLPSATGGAAPHTFTQFRIGGTWRVCNGKALAMPVLSSLMDTNPCGHSICIHYLHTMHDGRQSTVSAMCRTERQNPVGRIYIPPPPEFDFDGDAFMPGPVALASAVDAAGIMGTPVQPVQARQLVHARRMTMRENASQLAQALSAALTREARLMQRSK